MKFIMKEGGKGKEGRKEGEKKVRERRESKEMGAKKKRERKEECKEGSSVLL